MWTSMILASALAANCWPTYGSVPPTADLDFASIPDAVALLSSDDITCSGQFTTPSTLLGTEPVTVHVSSNDHLVLCGKSGAAAVEVWGGTLHLDGSDGELMVGTSTGGLAAFDGGIATLEHVSFSPWVDCPSSTYTGGTDPGDTDTTGGKGYRGPRGPWPYLDPLGQAIQVTGQGSKVTLGADSRITNHFARAAVWVGSGAIFYAQDAFITHNESWGATVAGDLDSEITLERTLVEGNTGLLPMPSDADFDGAGCLATATGGIASDGVVTIDGSVFRDNVGEEASAVCAEGPLTIHHSRFRDNVGTAVVGHNVTHLTDVQFSDNLPYTGSPSDLLVRGVGYVDGGGILSCGSTEALRMASWSEGTEASSLDGLLVLGSGRVLQSIERPFAVSHATVVLENPEPSVPFAGNVDVGTSVLVAPGLDGLHESVHLHDDLVLPPFDDVDGILVGQPVWMTPGFPALCKPGDWRLLAGTAGTFQPGAPPSDPADTSDDWGAWGADPVKWVHLLDADLTVLAGEESASDRLTHDGDGDGAVWAYDCAEENGEVSALEVENCGTDADENCDGRALGGEVRPWPVDRDLDGRHGWVVSCQQPTWSAPETVADCDDFDPSRGRMVEAFVDGDGDGWPVLAPFCEDELPGGWEGYDDALDCDDDDPSAWRTWPVLRDQDDDDAPEDPGTLDPVPYECMAEPDWRVENGHYDCDDLDGGRAPHLPEVPDDGIDQDCDGRDAQSFVVGGCQVAPGGSAGGWWSRRP